jgi:hypothetical protein
MTWSGRAACPLVILLVLLMPAPARAQVAFEFFLGTAFNVPTTLTVDQTGYPPIAFTAHYEVKPLDDYAYYAYRLGLWQNNRAWIVELLHHKLYLENPQGEVEHFEVTHGYNLITLNRGWRRGANTLMFGGGVVVARPHSTIRGQTFAEGYYLSGVTIQGVASRRFVLTRRVFATAEGKLTASWARVPVVDGHATVPNSAFHLLAGLGLQF